MRLLLLKGSRAGFILLLIAVNFPPQDIFCQPIENHFTHYTTKDGLADGLISSIIQDSTGFLWLGNENGLSRFDGHAFKIYRYSPLDTNSLRENRIFHLFMDSKKRLWVMSLHWLYLYHPDGEWFEHFGINTLTADNLIWICVEESGQLVIAGHRSLYKFDMQKKKFSFFYHPGIPVQRFNDYKKDEEGIEWIACQNGLIRYDPKEKKSVLFDSSVLKHKTNDFVSVSRIILLPDNYLLASTSNMGLILVNRKTNNFKQFLIHKLNPDAPLEIINYDGPLTDNIDGIYQLNDSIILCSCAGGLSVLNWRTEVVSYFKPDKQNPSSLLENDTRIYSIFKDREGIIWLGGDYLEKYDFKDYKVKIFSQPANESMPRQFAEYFDLYRCSNGKFLLGSYGDLGIYDSSTGFRNYLSHDRINFFNEDGLGNVWCRIKEGIGVFTIENNWQRKIKKYIIPGDAGGFYDLKLDKKGRVLVATSGRGLGIFDTTAKTFTFFNASSSPPSQLTNSSATAICEDHNGCIWIGTQKGLNKIEKDGITVKQYSQNRKRDALSVDWRVNNIKEDKYGTIWFTTNEQGIGRIDPRNDSVNFLGIAQGLPTSWFNELCIDDEDNLWALSKMGVLNMNVVTLQNKLYTEEEGFPSPEDINTIHYSNYNKKLYILTPYSILEIDPKSINNNNKIPPTSVTGFLVFNEEKPVSNAKEIFLKYNENFIDIKFACLLFHSNSQIEYAYKMEGIDTGWVYCNYDRDASYTKLPPGHYIFNVKAQSPEGVWNNTPTQLFIVIKPPFWQTWWFYLAEAIAALAFVFWIIQFYIARTLAKQRTEFEKLQAISAERMRIASDMHDDFGSGLTTIRLLSEVANLKAGKDNLAKSEIEKIVKSTEHLSENLREIIWTMNTRFDKLEDFIIYIRAYAVEFFDNSLITFRFNKPAIIPEIKMSGELRRNLFLCIKESLNNIVKHSCATEAELSFDIKDDVLFTEIRDNGKGIDTSQINKFGNGLNSMKERLNKYGSDLKIEINYGTYLRFEIDTQK